MVERRDNDESFGALFERTHTASSRQRQFRAGERVEVTVVAIGRDAVFADLGAKQEGFFEKPELCDAEGKLSVAIGARVSAVVASVDGGTGQVRLSPVFVRRPAEDPEALGEREDGNVVIPVSRSAPLMIEGARVKGKVTGVERYGIFVQIAGTQGRGGRGLIPTTETGTPRGADLKKLFTVGQDLEAKILHIAEDGKIRLSVSALKVDEERGEFEAFAQKDKKAGPAVPEKRGFGTLADLLTKKGR